MKKEGRKTIVRLNRPILYCAILCCAVGVIASIIMFFVLENETTLPEETNIFQGQIIFVCFAVLLIAATVYCVSKLWITVSFSEHSVHYSRAFRKTHVRTYNYYKNIYFGYKAKTGNLIADSKKTYYIVITRNIYDEHELKHMGNIDMSHQTIKLIFNEGLCRNLYRTFPVSHKNMLLNSLQSIKKDSKTL